jgi:Ca2+-binding EF-hand superfamily protein
MKQAFLTEKKIKFEKTEILLLLNQFDINKNPEIEYYPASLILRNIVEYLLSGEIGMEKIDINQPQYLKYEHYFDDYDKYCNQIKEIFIRYDEDYDHLLNKNEFKKFITWLIPYIQDDEIEERFCWMDQDKDGVLNYQEFKNSFKELMERIRINNVMKTIKTIKEEKQEIVEEEKKEENENENEKEENKED